MRLLILLLVLLIFFPFAASAYTEYSYGTAYASSNYDPAYAPAKAFDHDSATAWIAKTSSSQTTSWLMMDYGGSPHIINNYTIQATLNTDGSLPIAWNISGSNDNTTYTVLDSISGQSFGSYETKKYPLPNTASYRYYKLSLTSLAPLGGQYYGSAAEWNLFNDPADTTPPSSITGLTNTTANCENITWSWTNPGGSLNTDYSHLYSLKNDAWIGNYSNSTSAATWTGLTNNTQYTMSTKTVDLKYNMNATWVNATSTTAVCSAPVTPTPTPTPTPVPTAVPSTQWCGLKTLYFDHGSSVLPIGYESLNETITDKPQVSENVTLINTAGMVLIDSYISPQGYPGSTYLESGTAVYHMYGYVSNAGGVTKFNISMYIRDTTGTETLQYQGTSAEIDNLVVGEIKTNFAHPRIYLNPGDRMVVKIGGQTDSASSKQLYWIYQGVTAASYIESAYFYCQPLTTITTPAPWQPEINPPTDYKTDLPTLIKDWWFVPVTIAAFMIIFGKR